MNDPRPNPARRPSIDEIEAILRDDAAFEPPARLVAAVRKLGADALVARRNAAGITRWTATVGAIFDNAGAIVRQWLTPQGELAFAGLRDDRGADTLEIEERDADLSVRAERTPVRDGRVRIVGEATRLDGSAVRSQIVLLDGARQVQRVEDSDALGMFALDLADDTRILAIVPRGGTAVLLELDAPRGAKS
jgi:hypothetical protein